MCVFGAFIYDAIADGKNRFIFKNFKESEFLISGLNFMGGSQFEIKKIAPASKATADPKQMPGNTVGSNNPKEKPTAAAFAERT